jgi:hypothetical protein
MDRFEIQPSVGLGCLQLGCTIGEIIHAINTQLLEAGKVQLHYLVEDPLAADIEVFLTKPQIKLLFDPVSQRLRTIDLMDLMALSTAYSGKEYTTIMSALPDFRTTYRIFGPTYPGKLDLEAKVFALEYPGCAILFDLPSELISTWEGKVRDEGAKLTGLKPEDLGLPKDMMMNATRMLIYAGRTYEESLAIHASIRATAIACNIIAQPGKGICFEALGAWITFDDHAQDVLAELGAPNDVFYKGVDKMKIHAFSERDGRPLVDDYFFNYYNLGVDVLMDGFSHKVKKFVLHTNLVSKHNFVRYQKCNYKLVLGKEAAAELIAMATSTDGPMEEKAEQKELPRFVTPEDKVRQVSLFMVSNYFFDSGKL